MKEECEEGGKMGRRPLLLRDCQKGETLGFETVSKGHRAQGLHHQGGRTLPLGRRGALHCQQPVPRAPCAPAPLPTLGCVDLRATERGDGDGPGPQNSPWGCGPRERESIGALAQPREGGREREGAGPQARRSIRRIMRARARRVPLFEPPPPPPPPPPGRVRCALVTGARAQRVRP